LALFSSSCKLSTAKTGLPAAANRAKYGRTKAERKLLDGAKRETVE
jgi:hypothetical protein